MNGNDEKSAVNNHTSITNSMDSFKDRFVIVLRSELKNSMIPDTMQIIADSMNEYKYFGESLNIIALNTGTTMNMPNIIVTKDM